MEKCFSPGKLHLPWLEASESINDISQDQQPRDVSNLRPVSMQGVNLTYEVLYNGHTRIGRSQKLLHHVYVCKCNIFFWSCAYPSYLQTGVQIFRNDGIVGIPCRCLPHIAIDTLVIRNLSHLYCNFSLFEPKHLII